MAWDDWRRFVGLIGKPRRDRDLDEEIQAHYEHLRRAFENEGDPPDEAARRARLRLGGAIQIREAAADEWRLGWIEGLWQDVRFAARGLARRPGFAAAAIATLALGIGASTAIFSVAWGVSLRPLPYAEPDRLVRIYESNLADNQPKQDVSQGAFQAWREGADVSLESAALYGNRAMWPVLVGAETVRLPSMAVTPRFFDVLRIPMALGQGFGADSYTRFTLREVVLSHGAWQRLLGGQPDVIGQSLTVPDRSGGNDVYRIVGVLPADFRFIEDVDLWRPQIVELPVARILYNWRYDHVIARLRPGVTLAAARAELESVTARMAGEHPASNRGWTVRAESLHDAVVGDFGRATTLLLGAVAIVLLVACLNVGGLMVARAVSRDRETAVRAALGAGTWRLLRLWLTEAVIVSVAGAATGLVLAWLGVRALRAVAPPGIPRIDAIAIDAPTLLVALVSTLVAMATFAVAPSRLRRSARRGTPGDLTSTLRASTAAAGDSRRRQVGRALLIGVQCAGAVTLAVLATLLTRSFLQLTHVDLGWTPNGVLSLQARPPWPADNRRPWFWLVNWSDRLVGQLETAPGVVRAAVTTQIPLSATQFPQPLAAGRTRTPDQQQWAGVLHNVTDGYFDVMGIEFVKGRTFNRDDRFPEAVLTYQDRADHGVAVVTESTARTLWPGQDPIGQAVRLPDIDNVPWREVVGVVRDIRFYAVGETPTLHVFVPWTEFSTGNSLVVVRGTTTGAALVPTVREVVERVQPGTVIDQVAPLETLVSNATAQPRFTSRLVVGFGALALVLAAVGLYGTLAFIVASQRREFGIRLALGASRGGVVRQVLRRGLVPAAAGVVAGLALAAAVARAFQSVLFEVAPLDVIAFATGAAVLLAVALLASLGPAWRAARTDPVSALRTD